MEITRYTITEIRENWTDQRWMSSIEDLEQAVEVTSQFCCCELMVLAALKTYYRRIFAGENFSTFDMCKSNRPGHLETVRRLKGIHLHFNSQFTGELYHLNDSVYRRVHHSLSSRLSAAG